MSIWRSDPAAAPGQPRARGNSPPSCPALPAGLGSGLVARAVRASVKRFDAVIRTAATAPTRIRIGQPASGNSGSTREPRGDLPYGPGQGYRPDKHMANEDHLKILRQGVV